jgi:hypothetical protein
MSEDRCQRADVRGQRTDVRGQMSEDRCQRTDVRGQRTDVRGQRYLNGEFGMRNGECGRIWNGENGRSDHGKIAWRR